MNRYLRAALAALFAVVLVTGVIAPAVLPGTSFPALAEQSAATAAPTATATARPTMVPTAKPTVVPTPVPTATPTPVPTMAPTPTPEPTPTAEPTAEPTPEPTPTPFANGASGDDVKKLQENLSVWGFYTGDADGIFGSKTEAAVRDYQQYRYNEYLAAQTPAPTAEPTAEPTPEPTPDPNATATPEPTRDPSLPAAIPMQQGAWDTATDTTVSQMQQKLIDLRCLYGTADGIFGAQTAEAVKLFQSANGLAQTGVIDGETYHMLMSASAQPGPEPTPTPYAPNGVVDDLWKEEILNGTFEVYRGDLESGSEGAEVKRLQTRLTQLWYYGIGIDSQYGGATQRAVSYFQQRNSLPETGVADEATQRLLFSAEAIKSDRPATPYKLVVDVSDQRVYAYEWVNGSYTNLVRTMVCSTGLPDTPTPIGTWAAGGACGRWYYFKKFDCWAQYAYRINGPYLFHSVIYSEKDTSTLRQSSVNNLGRRASHGCVRLKVEDAKWIYNNCPANTLVQVRN